LTLDIKGLPPAVLWGIEVGGYAELIGPGRLACWAGFTTAIFILYIIIIIFFFFKKKKKKLLIYFLLIINK
jgi:hypothetical protein